MSCNFPLPFVFFRCTRWFLPLLLLPLPTASPYFLMLFLFSLTMHAKPCFYCIVLLTTLFVSSCYWQPFPLDSSLSAPWAGNITTFAEALNGSLSSNYSHPFPNVIQAVDRCWCDFSVGGFFEPFNVTHWEYVSVQRLKDDLERKKKSEEALEKKEIINDTETLLTPTAVGSFNLTMPRTAAPSPSSSVIPLKSAGRDLRSIFRLFHYTFKAEDKRPLFRREYDLRPYGLGILVDFGWTR
ncbi:hypothetical protein J132_01691 [Termitomyces sp. J132]|nr:hypothetical protein J132_01691 [Termitomyces sp. J132]